MGLKLKKLLKSKTVHGLIVAALAPELAPVILQNAPAVLDVLGVSGATAGKVVALAGIAYGLYGRAVAKEPLTS